MSTRSRILFALTVPIPHLSGHLAGRFTGGFTHRFTGRQSRHGVQASDRSRTEDPGHLTALSGPGAGGYL